MFSLLPVGFYLKWSRNSSFMRKLCSQTPAGQEANPFFDTRVQHLLKKLTGLDIKKVYRRRREGQRLEPPQYKFMNTADLEKARAEALLKAEKKIQMPPVLPPRKEVDYVFEEDPKLIGYSNSKFIFTDISFGQTDRSRTIVTRDVDGTLRKANWDERARMNEIFFPRPGRKLTTPAMFEPKNLQSLLERGEYEFILDRACLQFEPDDPSYIEVTRSTYDRVNKMSNFDSLRSTRHYGPLVYHLVTVKKDVDNLLLENISTDRLQDAVWLIDLYQILNPESDFKYLDCKPGEELDCLKAFIDRHAKGRKAELHLALNNFRDYLESPKRSEEASQQN